MRVDLSNGGTLFFDEVGELATPMQGQLVILLQPGFAGSGAQNEDENAQTRIMCSTSHLKLEEEAEAGGFRQDLYYYISVVCIRMPPLRERCADIPLILNYLLESYSDLYRRPRVPVPSEILSLAQAHAWPGNILQLENFVKRFVILGPENPLLKEMLRPSSGANEMFSARG